MWELTQVEYSLTPPITSHPLTSPSSSFTSQWYVSTRSLATGRWPNIAANISGVRPFWGLVGTWSIQDTANYVPVLEWQKFKCCFVIKLSHCFYLAHGVVRQKASTESMCSKRKSAQNAQVHPWVGQGLSLALSKCERPLVRWLSQSGTVGQCSHVMVHCPTWSTATFGTVRISYVNHTGGAVLLCKCVCLCTYKSVHVCGWYCMS